uniref:Uncharacterized protein n=1 Tax=Acrobeloides nanus TaxID=290746 RepID=A0A914EGJ1_9BILA
MNNFDYSNPIFLGVSAKRNHFFSDQQFDAAIFPINNLTQQWPPYSPDENGLDYSIWGYLEAKACEKPHNSVTTLKKAIRKAWNEMPQDLVQRVVDAFLGRLQACIDAGGSHFE